MTPHENSPSAMAGKVAEVTFAFWVIKICATTLGETGGDSLSMTLKLGYALSTGIFLLIFLAAAGAQIAARRYHPFLYWGVIVSTTTVGTTTADYLTRTGGLGYVKGSAVLFAAVLAILAAWRWSTGSISVSRITTPKAEAYYWLAIVVSNTLGTALGDFLADDPRFGYTGGALVFGGALLLVAGLYFFTRLSRPALFWAAFILTRPLGATLGDILTKPRDHGGLELSTIASTAVIAAAMIPLIALLSRKPETQEPTPTAAS